MRTISIKVPDELHEKLRQYCHDERTSITTVLRILIQTLLDQKERAKHEN